MAELKERLTIRIQLTGWKVSFEEFTGNPDFCNVLLADKKKR